MSIFFVILLLSICSGNSLLNLHVDYEKKDFKILSLHLKKFFSEELTTVALYTNAGNNYKRLNELAKELQIQTNGNIHIYNEDFDYILSTFQYIFLLNFKFPKIRLNFTKKLLIYYDMRDFNCADESVNEYFVENLNFTENKSYYDFFNCLFLMEMPRDCENPYELFVGEFWGDHDLRRIADVKYAYFNQKPNLHQERISLDLQINPSRVQNVGELFKGKKYVFAKHVLKKWNTSVYDAIDKSYIGWVPKLFFQEYPFMNNKFEHVNYMQSYCVVIQKSDYHPPWQALPRSFETSVWVCLIISWITSGIVWYFLEKITSTFLKSLSLMLSIYVAQSVDEILKRK